MKNMIFAILVSIFVGLGAVYTQDKTAEKLADDVAAAFSNRVSDLDKEKLLRGRLAVSMQDWIPVDNDPEFRAKTFRDFNEFERWLKADENQPGFPVRTSGERISCRKGLCHLDLKDGQMMHNHVYLTRIWYGYSKGKIYIKRLRILYG